MLARTILTLIALGGSLACSSLSAEQRGPEIADFTLANGLELVVIPDRRAPVVTHMIWYKVGAADETPGKSGLAHFLEHLMFKGTAKNPAGKFSQVVARIGGQENAFTSQDYTGYFQRVPSDQLKTVMEFEADRMTGLQLTARAERNSRGAEPARRKQPSRPSHRANRGCAVSQSPLRKTGYRLAAGNGRAVAR